MDSRDLKASTNEISSIDFNGLRSVLKDWMTLDSAERGKISLLGVPRR